MYAATHAKNRRQAPSLMSGLEKRYIRNVRKAGKTLDMTPEGRQKKAPGALEW
jgi:hypothetical protein